MTMSNESTNAVSAPRTHGVRVAASARIHRGGRGVQVIYGIVVFGVIGVSVPVSLLLGSSQSTGENVTVFQLLIIGTLSAFGLARIVALGEPHYMRMSYYVFCYVFIYLAGTIQVVDQTFPLDGRTYSSQTLSMTSTLFLVGFLAHEIGYRLGPALTKAGPASRAPAPAAVTFRRIAIAVAVVGVVASASAVARYGITPFFESRESVASLSLGDDGGAAYATEGKAQGLLYARLIHVPVFVALYLSLWARASARRDHGSSIRHEMASAGLRSLPLLIVLVALNVILNNPLGNSRLWAGLVLFAVASTFVDLSRPKVVAGVTSAFLLMYIVVFPYADLFRRDDTAQSVEVQSPRTLLASDGSFSAFQTAANGVEYLAVSPHTYGQQILGGVLTFVPRSIWGDKPVDTGALIDSRYNRASTLWTEGQVDFGLIGVALLMLALGLVTSKVDTRFAAQPVGSLAALAVPILAPFYVFLLRGSLSAAMGALIPLMVFVAIAIQIDRRSASGSIIIHSKKLR
ncbi:MAG: hypothetical protein OSB43_09600 [Nocardioides sp.]|uniref:hypothetical protein n=1 Tax=Nocardioides sp. TaxID=35761 RepID=UPI0023A0A131|nr:hypothetical protein [Nocardioides sp.]MDE0776514.1 hypothetical protein [Nocardioides sp.]